VQFEGPQGDLKLAKPPTSRAFSAVVDEPLPWQNVSASCPPRKVPVSPACDVFLTGNRMGSNM
jgi:hypothetical protein